jgi:hypothetical protein
METDAMASPKLDVFALLLKMCRNETLRVAGSVPPERRLFQLKEGKAHPLWLVGHLANTVNSVVLQWMLQDQSLAPKGFGRKFAPDFIGGAPVTANPDDYLPWDDVLGIYEKVLTQAIDGLAKLNDADLPNPLKGDVPEGMRDFFKTNEITLGIMIGHDSYHRGQIGLLSRLEG